MIACQNDTDLYNAVKESTTLYSYATSITYAWSLKHDYIEKYNLTRFDKMALENTSEKPQEQDKEQFYYVILGYYRSLSNAQKFADQLKAKGIITSIKKGRLD